MTILWRYHLALEFPEEIDALRAELSGCRIVVVEERAEFERVLPDSGVTVRPDFATVDTRMSPFRKYSLFRFKSSQYETTRGVGKYKALLSHSYKSTIVQFGAVNALWRQGFPVRYVGYRNCVQQDEFSLVSLPYNAILL